MRVLVTTPLYPPEMGGPATYAALIESELPKRGIDVSVLSFGEMRHLPNAIRHIVYFFKILRLGRGVDVIYAQGALSTGWPSYFSNLFLRKKLIIKIVGDHVWEQMVQRTSVRTSLDDFSPSYLSHPYFGFLRILQRITVAGAHKIIVPSEYLKRIVKKWGVPPQKISVIYNAFDSPTIEEGREEVRNDLGIDGKMIFFAGRFVPWKGIDILMKATSTIKEVRLYIAGDGPLEEELKKEAPENTLFVGRLLHDDLLRYLKACDAFVLPSQYEGFSHLLLEALSLGVPTIASKVGGNTEIIEDEHTGLLVPYGDVGALKQTIIRVLGDNELRERLGKNGQKKVAEFNTHRMIDELVNELSLL